MNINIIAPVNKLSYGLLSTNILKELILQGHQPALFEIGRIDCEEKDRQYIAKAKENSAFFDKNATSLRIFHQFSLAEHVGKSLHIGMSVFELTKFNKVEAHHLKSCDRLCVLSGWARNILIENDIKSPEDISVVPAGVDREIFNENITTAKLPQFIVLNTGKAEVRKSHDVLVDVFNLAFTSSDNVELWMMMDSPFYPPEVKNYWTSLYKDSPLGDKIRLIPWQNTQRDVARIMAMSDVYISMARSEGWNLPLLEAMSCGKQCIGVDYSGSTEFTTKENCHLIQIEDMEPALDNFWFRENFGGEWASLDKNQIDQAVSYLRELYQKKIDGKLLVNTEGIKTAQSFSWTNSVNCLIKALQ